MKRERLLLSRSRSGFWKPSVRQLRLLEKPIPVACAHMILLQILAHQLYCDGTPSSIGVLLRVIAQRIKVGQIIANGCKCLCFVFPALSEIGFASSGLAHAFEHCSRDW